MTKTLKKPLNAFQSVSFIRHHIGIFFFHKWKHDTDLFRILLFQYKEKFNTEKTNT